MTYPKKIATLHYITLHYITLHYITETRTTYMQLPVLKQGTLREILNPNLGQCTRPKFSPRPSPRKKSHNLGSWAQQGNETLVYHLKQQTRTSNELIRKT